jgi:hypothetical protein
MIAAMLGPMPLTAVMRTVDERIVRAPAEAIFGLAADVERWPELLTHYRYVRFRPPPAPGAGQPRVVEMSANRPFGPVGWPTWWVSLMEIRTDDRGGPSIRFRHIEGITTRMEVEWSFAPVTDGTHVTVLHLWNGPSWPLIGRVAARAVIGPLFVHGIASRTLAGLAHAAEQRQTSMRAFTSES